MDGIGFISVGHDYIKIDLGPLEELFSSRRHGSQYDGTHRLKLMEKDHGQSSGEHNDLANAAQVFKIFFAASFNQLIEQVKQGQDHQQHTVYNRLPPAVLEYLQ